jgi:hypothetical protein
MPQLIRIPKMKFLVVMAEPLYLAPGGYKKRTIFHLISGALPIVLLSHVAKCKGQLMQILYHVLKLAML